MAVTIMAEFALRLAFGLAFAVALVSPRWVAAGFFRIQLWIVMGLNTLAALAVAADRGGTLALATIIGAAFVSYVGSVLWLYERLGAGRRTLTIVTALDFAAAFMVAARGDDTVLWQLAEIASSGFLLGTAVTTMLLGHWYLNAPTMNLTPIKRLTWTLGVAIGVRALVSVWPLVAEASGMPATGWWLLVTLRWVSGIVGALVLTCLTWQTLKIPNTQSATGILYVVVIGVFLGELAGQLLATTPATVHGTV